MFRIAFLVAFGLGNALSFAQGAYYHATDGVVPLTHSTTQFIITADEPSLLEGAAAAGAKQYQHWPHKPYAVMEMSAPATPAGVVAALGFDTDEVQVSPGYALADGYVIYPTRNLAVKLHRKTDRAAVEQRLAKYGVVAVTEKYGTLRVRLARLADVLEAANDLQESGLTVFAHPDFYAPVSKFQIDDPKFGEQFQLHNTGQVLDGIAGTPDVDCNALEAWDISLGSSAITVAVIDDGVEPHEDFRAPDGQSRLRAGFTPANSGNGRPGTGAAHGVACAGTIAAGHNTLGVRGVAPLVDLISVNIFWGGESNQDLADAISWSVNQGADVLSNSWGFGSCTYSIAVLDNALADAARNGRGGKGCLITFATGNDYNNCVSYPADHPDVVAVGAVANTGARSAYSNYGPAIDLVAPSNNVGGPGAGVRTTDRMGNAGYSAGNYTDTFGGTSSATPVVSGVAALLLGYNPALSAEQAKDILYATATDMGTTGFDVQFGHGRVNAQAALLAAGTPGEVSCTDGLQNGDETGVDCGGGDCPDCPATGCNGTEVTLTIELDNYPEETSWEIQNGGGITVASGGTYGNLPDGSTLTETICLADGCYTLVVNDAYGDGLCCRYGEGGYALVQDQTVLATGGAFNAREATDFCLSASGNDTQAPTTPATLSVSNETETTVDLKWAASTDNVAVNGYQIYVDGAFVASLPAGEVSATLTGLASCVTYTFGVAATDAAGNTSNLRSAPGTTTGCASGGPVDIDGAYFETGLDGWTDGGGDCYRYFGPYSFEGDRSMRLRDNSGTRSSMTSPVYDLSGLSNVELSFTFYPRSMETGEDFFVRYDDGSGWRTVASYARGASFDNNSFYTATVVLDAGQYTLGAAGRFRIQCDASTNNDQIYVDAVTVRGNVSTGITPTKIEEIPSRILFSPTETAEGAFDLSPNPASERLTITAGEPIREITLTTLAGRRVLHRRIGLVPSTTLNVSGLPTGLYLVSVTTTEERSVERVVVRR